MRRLQRAKPQKNSRRKINKKKRVKSSNSVWNIRCTTSNTNLENINEAFRIHVSKKARSSSRCFWKLVPKDSLEVYKERRKRQIGNKQPRPRCDNSSRGNAKNSNGIKESKDRKSEKRINKTKKRGNRKASRDRRSRSESSTRSRTTTTTSRDSRDCLSDMDFE